MEITKLILQRLAEFPGCLDKKNNVRTWNYSPETRGIPKCLNIKNDDLQGRMTETDST